LGLAPPLRKVLNSIVASALGYSVTLLLPVSGPLLILKLLGIGGLVILCLFALRDFTPRELGLLRSAVSLPDDSRARQGAR